ncbi:MULTISPECIES: hypothetical protein [Streptomyces violaceusniger group]|nr:MULTISPECIES: hypothetical protein [Streptomyces violaceusniger group]
MEFDNLSRLCLFVDVQGYGKRSLPEQSRVQGWLAEALERMRESAGLEERDLSKQGQGDGCLLLAHPSLPLPMTLARLTLGLMEAVEWVNEPLKEAAQIQLRAAFDTGVVRHAANGYVGRAVISVARLVNSKPLRNMLVESPDSPLALAVSDSLYQDVVLSGLPGLPVNRFQQVAIEEKEYAGWAWLLAPHRNMTDGGHRDVILQPGPAQGDER